MDQYSEDKKPRRRPPLHVQTSTIRPIYVYAENLISNAAAAMTWPVTSLYLHNYLHQSFLIIGVILMLGSLVSMLAAWGAGLLFDRWRPYHSFIIALSICLFGSLMMLCFHDWPIYVPWLMILNIGIGMLQTLINSYGAYLSTDNPKHFFSNMAITLNIGTVIGTFFGTWIFDKMKIQGMMLLAIVFYLEMLGLAILFFRVQIRPASMVLAAKQPSRLAFSRLLIAIGALTMMTYLTYQFWETVMSPHMVSLGMSIEQYGYLWTINGLVIIFFQNLVTKATKNWSFMKTVVIGTFIFALSFPPLIWANRFWQMILITIVLVVGEMLFSPGTTAWIAHLVPAQFQGQGMAFISAMISLGRAIGPVYAGIFMDRGWIFALFMSSFFLLLILDGVVYIFGRSKNKSLI
ncbi:MULTISPECIES: MFS transporter [Oenococcus]|uniref:Permease of the major facilitator superfamily n=1 Tax=Oenococcus kitaharae DSM 17330 TaxID=1045004 RepID=G9WJ41_9LACO|nr:MFS transporter [Oenococcus kitaharae]EHN58490.1 permease of the major facilitator superfamily [Oenococcus kitaharae DSM 17330]OEY81358.1 major facilitator transporter [Oenococcus kitaharae]OEY82846.1 major facilitator transporter [Oenococcus kitaharae]OEY84610.1 major facilitator transporter [Oenococcus kitaharae]